jgi:ArsR family transcriptional regulator
MTKQGTMIKNLELLKALSDMNRLRIVTALGHYEELCACQITELLQVTGATVSRHVGVLQHAGVLKSRKEGRWVYYRLDPPADAEKLFQWLNTSVETSDVLESDRLALKKIVGIGREELCRMQRGEDCCPK